MSARARAVLASTLGVGLVLGGCVLKRSNVARTYVLDPLAAREAPAPNATPVATVGVEKVGVPDWLDRPQVTGRTASGEVVTDEFSRWGEPLARGVQRVVAENLAALLPDRRVLGAPFPPRDAVDHRVRVTLVEAARQAGGSVLVEARWEVLGSGGEVLSRHRSSHRAAPSAAGAAGAVAGVSEALDLLSREIADLLRTLPLPSRGAGWRKPGAVAWTERNELPRER